MTNDLLQTENLLLRSLSKEDRILLQPNLSRCDLAREMILNDIGEPTARFFFIEEGIASCVAVEGSSRTEVGLVGLEGVTGVNALLGDDLAPYETFIQVDGGTALSIGTQDLRKAMDNSATLRRALLLYVNTFISQVSFGLVACAQHRMEARLARWLLMCHYRVEGDDVSLTLHSLEGAGMIRSTRGLVTIRDRGKLADLAGDSYGLPERRYRALIGEFGKSR